MKQYAVPDLLTVLTVGSVWMFGLATAAFYTFVADGQSLSTAVVGAVLAAMGLLMIRLAFQLSASDEKAMAQKLPESRPVQLRSRHSGRVA